MILANTSDPEVIFGALTTKDDGSINMMSDFSPLHILPEITSVLHHSNSFSEITFSEPDVLNITLKARHLLPNYSELSSRSGGVRDAYSSFWNEFLNCAPLEHL